MKKTLVEELKQKSSMERTIDQKFEELKKVEISLEKLRFARKADT